MGTTTSLPTSSGLGNTTATTSNHLEREAGQNQSMLVEEAYHKENDIDNGSFFVSSSPPEKGPQDNNEAGDVDSTEWYKDTNGSFFREPRVPFFRFNFVAYLASMGIFLWMAYVITRDFIDQQDNPPTSTQLKNDLTQALPGLLVCNLDDNAPLTVMGAFYDNFTNDWGYNVTDQVYETNCSDIANDSRNEEDASYSNCVQINTNLPAFNRDEDNQQACATVNTLTLILNVNEELYSNVSLFLGVDVFLYQPDVTDFTTAFCQTVSPQCQTLASSEDKCSSDIGDLAFDTLTLSTTLASQVILEAAQNPFSTSCDQPVTTYQPTVTMSQFNPRAYQNRLVASQELPPTSSVVYLVMQFRTPRIAVTTFNPLSAQSMFGSLSGWFGFLTDGWGIISVLYFSERLLLYVRDYYERRRGVS